MFDIPTNWGTIIISQYIKEIMNSTEEKFEKEINKNYYNNYNKKNVLSKWCIFIKNITNFYNIEEYKILKKIYNYDIILYLKILDKILKHISLDYIITDFELYNINIFDIILDWGNDAFNFKYIYIYKILKLYPQLKYLFLYKNLINYSKYKKIIKIKRFIDSFCFNKFIKIKKNIINEFKEVIYYHPPSSLLKLGGLYYQEALNNYNILLIQNNYIK